ncbi:Caveolin-1 [Gossypium australe]|uniref:Caveolin-1 n=1 Tax=Gossypium australe TaxID=47621 RepID=A0A5B6UIN4_9ROSI|nr:Caveolin-1 [Gossypium australe]
MLHSIKFNFFIPIYIVIFIVSSSIFSHGKMQIRMSLFSLLLFSFFFFFCRLDGAVLNVGEELKAETLPLKMGSRVYKLQGLKSLTWYEVKISYPASIPASFSLQLKKGDLESGLNRNRRLLNTEKLIFKTDNLDSINDQGGLHVLVTVEPEGFVAIPNTKEREFIIFNIVCDELLLGIPYYAWWVVVFVVLCLVSALIIPRYLPSYLLQDQNVAKQS